MPKDFSDDRLRLVARLYYLDGLDQSEVARFAKVLRRLALARARGILFQALPYTADTTAYAQLLEPGLASFATDYPDVTMREIKAYNARPRAAAPR